MIDLNHQHSMTVWAALKDISISKKDWCSVLDALSSSTLFHTHKSVSPAPLSDTGEKNKLQALYV